MPHQARPCCAFTHTWGAVSTCSHRFDDLCVTFASPDCSELDGVTVRSQPGEAGFWRFEASVPPYDCDCLLLTAFSQFAIFCTGAPAGEPTGWLLVVGSFSPVPGNNYPATYWQWGLVNCPFLIVWEDIAIPGIGSGSGPCTVTLTASLIDPDDTCTPSDCECP